MKRFNCKTFIALAGLSAIFSMFSCNFELPEKISVKTSGTKYNFPLGSGSFLLREKMSASELRKTFNENLGDDAAEIKVYDYNPTQKDSDVIRYLIKYPIQEISLGLAADGSNEIDFTTEISISNLKETISNAVQIDEFDLPVVEPGNLLSSSTPLETSLDFNISKLDFSTIEVNTGTFDIEVETSDTVSSDFVMNVGLALCDSSGEEIASADSRDIANGTGSTPFTLELSGKNLYPDMKIKFSGTISGGTALTKHVYKVKITPKNFVISKVTGLTMTAEDLGDIDNDSSTDDGVVGFSNDFDFTGASDYLVSARINKGGLNFYGMLPDGWSGVTLNVDKISVTQPKNKNEGDGLSLTESKFTDVNSSDSDASYLFNKQADLSEARINPLTITLKGEASISFDNATLTFADSSSGAKIEIGGEVNIEKMGELTVNTSSLTETAETSGEIDTGLSFSTLLKDNLGDASNLVKNIQFTGIKGYVYAVQPGLDALNGVQFSSCTLEASYDVDRTSKSTSLIDGDTVKLVDTQLDLDSLADDDYMITSDVFTSTSEDGTETNNYSVTTKDDSICDLINELPDNLKIKYDLSDFSGATELTLNSDDFDTLQSLKSIQLYILLDIPLNITLNDTVDFPEKESTSDGKISILDVRELVRIINGDEEKENKDLLERDSSDDYEDYKKYLDIVDSVTIYYKAKNTTQFAIDGYINDATTGISKTLSFDTTGEDTSDSDYKTFSLTQDEIKSIFNNYPFNPIISLDIDADGTEKSIPRNAEFGLEGYVQLVLDGTVEVWNKNEE